MDVTGEVGIGDGAAPEADERDAAGAEVGFASLDGEVAKVAVAGADDRECRARPLSASAKFEMPLDTDKARPRGGVSVGPLPIGRSADVGIEVGATAAVTLTAAVRPSLDSQRFYRFIHLEVVSVAPGIGSPRPPQFFANGTPSKKFIRVARISSGASLARRSRIARTKRVLFSRLPPYFPGRVRAASISDSR